MLAGSGPDIRDARAALRQATQDAHERLHGHRAFTRLLSGTLTIADYRALLVRLYGFHLPLEQALIGSPEEWRFGIDIERCQRVCFLAGDLRFIDGGEVDLTALPLAPRPRVSKPGDFLGALYVREGAILGGKVMAGKLDRLLGAGSQGRSFLIGNGKAGALWRKCCEALERGREAGHLGDMIAAARAAFAAFELWLNNQ
jgi:heme oxygenase (biliverdin-IX-beta and delta-forming)